MLIKNALLTIHLEAEVTMVWVSIGTHPIASKSMVTLSVKKVLTIPVNSTLELG